MASIEIDAPAKVNLYLKVLNKRKDSYHNILTVFERIVLSDKIRISKIPNHRGIVVISDKPITKDPKENLAYKAAELILRYKRINNGVRIALKKRIPIAAGLGGGSSDAAGVLVGINKLFNLKLKEKALMRFAGKLGADVPFFVLNAPFALGRAKGDKLKKIGSKLRLWHLLVYPGFGVSTREIYEAFDTSASLSINPEHSRRVDASTSFLPKRLTRESGGVKITFPVRNLNDLGTTEKMLHNDLEEILKSKKRAIGSIIEHLAHITGKKFIVSGSGPSVFCLYRTRKEAEGARKKLLASVPAAERKGWQIFVTRTLN